MERMFKQNAGRKPSILSPPAVFLNARPLQNSSMRLESNSKLEEVSVPRNRHFIRLIVSYYKILSWYVYLNQFYIFYALISKYFKFYNRA